MAVTTPDARSLEAIPSPRTRPVIGNLTDIPGEKPIQALMGMSRRLGPIFKLTTPLDTRYFISGLEMVDDVCDETRFDKYVGHTQRTLREVRGSAGLITSDTDDPLWQRAHDILLPNFSTRAMQGYLPRMIDIADQLMLKWQRVRPDEPVDVVADMTRLTLDTIALCGFGYRLNSYYRDTPHPFVAAMQGVLAEASRRSLSLPGTARLRWRDNRRFAENNKVMDDLVAKIIAERRAGGEPGDDLLGHMIAGRDKHGEELPDDNIASQCQTFLIAGHETTSGLLSFAISFLLKRPDVVQRAYDEVDDVLGTDPSVPPTAAQLGRLTYLTQILDETLRMWPTAPAFTKRPLVESTVGGWGPFPPDTAIMVLTPMLHRLPEVWGPNADEWDPDHFRPEVRAALPPNAFKPFGTGQRACIGRQFAMQEATLVLGMLLQQFELGDHANYQLEVNEAMTLKPTGLTVTVRRRTGRTWGASPRGAGAAPGSLPTVTPAPAAHEAPTVAAGRHATPLLVLYGSNLGTAEDLAARIVRDAVDRGYAARSAALDDHTGDLPTEGGLVVVTASYNGQPPDNATRFCSWLAGVTPSDAAAAVRFAVFGCGNRDWSETYQRVPTRVDDWLAAYGATRIQPRGEGDARGDFDGQFEAWCAGLWEGLTSAFGLSEADTVAEGSGPRLVVRTENRRTASPVVRSYRAQPATVRVNRELTGGAATGGRSVRHLEIALPEGASYAAGDHLGVLPRNAVGLLNRVIARFGLDAGMYVSLESAGGAPTHLPTGEPYPLLGILAGCVELQDVAGRKDIVAMAAHTPEGSSRDALLALTGTDEASQARYQDAVAGPQRTLLDLLEATPECELPFAEFLDLLPPLRPRYYSISSSPQVTSEASVTVGVVAEPARDGSSTTYHGTCSTHLSETPEGGTVFCFVRQPTIPFRPPGNPHLPMIMVGAGTGMAPFRGFLQERAAMKEQGVPVAESLVVLGCRDPEVDQLYAGELAAWEAAGVARLRPAFSRVPDYPYRYVQHALEAAGDEVWDLMQQGAIVTVCGNASTMAPGVRAALVEVFCSRTRAGEADGAAWLAGLRAADRYLEDIWGES